MLVTIFEKLSIIFLLISESKIYSFGSNFDECNQYYEVENEDFCSDKVSDIYNQYLSREREGPNCRHTSERCCDISDDEFARACHEADQKLQEFIAEDEKYLATDPRGRNFSEYVYKAGLRANHNEVLTKKIATDLCLSEFETVVKLPKVQPPGCALNGFCDVDTNISPSVQCNPNYKYRRIDGKCNNLVYTNWGSNFHCQNRLLPPDFKDGVSEPRVDINGLPLPNPRWITTEYMFDNKRMDFSRTQMHMNWGQFIAHDTFKTLQYWALAIKCCPDPLIHRACYSITDIPIDKYAKAYNQSCLNFVRSIGCNTCSLGPRNEINAVTPTLDLSHIYGWNENKSLSLRTFERGELQTSKGCADSTILPEAVPDNYDLSKIDFSPCNPPLEKPWYTCFKTGDGIRGNQNPYSTSLGLLFVVRHNQHCRGLAKVNPHWNDEKLYQEAKRLLTAEYLTIHFKEFIPTIFNKQQLDYYQLSVLKHGFTEYNTKVNPSVFHSVGVGALRYGHSQVSTNHRVPQKHFFEDYTFTLRHKFFEVSDIWEGNSGAIMEGSCQMPPGKIDLHIDDDIHNFLFLNECNPKLIDLAAININRGRDHGVPAYIYYLEYCTGFQIKSWGDLYQFISEENVHKLKAIYNDQRNIDLFVGGLVENHLPDSALGPTFGCLLGIQHFHWKFGDRFYFEHSGQSASFTIEQLENIRKISWMSKLLCATTNCSALQENAFMMPSRSNRIIPCHKMEEFDYELWRESTSDDCHSFD